MSRTDFLGTGSVKQPLLRLSIHDQILQVKTLYLSTETPASLCSESPSGMVRIPVTQEFMADLLAAEARGDVPPHAQSGDFMTALNESIERMVGMLAERYSRTCVDNADDLKQDCMLRIWKKIGQFDSRKGRFTTWVWSVSEGVLRKKYRHSCRTRSVLVEEGGERECSGHYDPHNRNIIRMEIKDAVRQLIARHSDKKDIIYQMFGNPDDVDYIPQDNVSVARVARETKRTPGEVMTFWKRKAKPFLASHLKEKGSRHGQ